MRSSNSAVSKPYPHQFTIDCDGEIMTSARKSSSKIQRGLGSAERPVASELWRRDIRPEDPALAARGNFEPDHRQVDYKRYYDPAWADAEINKLFSKTWLFACRDEDIPGVGDRVPLDVGPLSFFVIRSKPDEFKAFYNACLHRGTALCVKAESGQTIRCPFHGWEWEPDGQLKRIPSHWDFAGVTRANGSLREVKLGRWGGFIFINADPHCAPLNEALQILPEHFKEFAPETRYTAARFRKRVLANWKISQEAFLEAYHLYATHPEAVPFSGDSQTQYDIWTSANGAVGRNASPGAMPSLHAGPEATVLAAAEMFAKALRDWHYPQLELPNLDPGGDLRAQVADWHSDAIERTYGRRPDLPNAMMLDSLLYFMFPHCAFWLCETLPFTYQFTPHPTDPGQSYFDVRMLLPCPAGKPRPPSSPAIEIGPDERVMDKAPAFHFLGFVFDQDMSNMPLIQKGVRAANPLHHHSLLGRYQEILIQHWNQLIDRYVSA
jgi:phenylpropionate dioxygenase-like ring-hydroxylating dioxygenase large terminal subunit